MNLQLFFRVVGLGIFATLIMDMVALLGFRAGLADHGSRRRGFQFIGRWIGYLMRGQVRHQDILLTPALPAEHKVGLATHYTTGIGLAMVYVASLKAIGTIPSIWLGHEQAFSVTPFMASGCGLEL